MSWVKQGRYRVFVEHVSETTKVSPMTVEEFIKKLNYRFEVRGRNFIRRTHHQPEGLVLPAEHLPEQIIKRRATACRTDTNAYHSGHVCYKPAY